MKPDDIMMGDESLSRIIPILRAAREELAEANCVSRDGRCPVEGCNQDGECYLWRCEHPHAPKEGNK